MLRLIASLLVLLCIGLSASAEMNAIDPRVHGPKASLSWVKDLNLQAERLTQTYQEEAREIVDKAISSASQQKHCAVAKNLAHQAEDIVRENLELSESEHSVRYPHLLVFVSFSIPIETLKTLSTQVNQVGGKVVLRGLVNGTLGSTAQGQGFKETVEKVKELQQEVIIDPTLFEEYQVKVVPTFILQSKETNKDAGTDSQKSENYDRLSGNVSLEYALEQFFTLGTTRAEALYLLKTLRKKP